MRETAFTYILRGYADFLEGTERREPLPAGFTDPAAWEDAWKSYASGARAAMIDQHKKEVREGHGNTVGLHPKREGG